LITYNHGYGNNINIPLIVINNHKFEKLFSSTPRINKKNEPKVALTMLPFFIIKIHIILLKYFSILNSRINRSLRKEIEKLRSAV